MNTNHDTLITVICLLVSLAVWAVVVRRRVVARRTAERRAAMRRHPAGREIRITRDDTMHLESFEFDRPDAADYALALWTQRARERGEIPYR